MDKKLFIKTIDSLHKQYAHDHKCSKAFQTILPDDHISLYDNHYLTGIIVEILQKEFNDEGKDSWIEYFIYELDYGKKYKHGSCNYKNGDIIDISNAGKLYDFLIKNQKK